MLHRLSIKNYAIIERLDIEFCERMNIITGETGAGKSILLGALGMILGERADIKVLYNAEEKCVLEAHFDVTGYELQSFFAEKELDYESHTIVRREMNQSGKSRAFINDTPVTLSVLKELGEKLVNLHSQHETLDLMKAGFQLAIIDSLAKNRVALSEYREKFSAYKKELKKLEALTEQNKLASAELDYIKFQLNELAEAKLKVGELDELETVQGTLNNVEEIKRSLENALRILNHGEYSLLDQLIEIQTQLKGVKSLHRDILAYSERLHSSYEELKDIANELENLQESTSLDPERLEEVNERLDSIYRLQKKHSVDTIEELLQIERELQQRIEGIDSNSTEIESLRKKLDDRLKELLQLANQLHHNREKVLREFQNNVVVLLGKVGMSNASFKVDIRKLPTDHLGEKGITEINFLFSANKGFMPLEMKDVASGGELSRLMLCIKSLVADADALPTMIFDEIDTGISGGTALKVGEIMKKLSRHHQIISITHLPQIARTADRHLYVYKEIKEARTYTRIKEIKGEERIWEIAKMLSGEQPTEAAMANARELVER